MAQRSQRSQRSQPQTIVSFVQSVTVYIFLGLSLPRSTLGFSSKISQRALRKTSTPILWPTSVDQADNGIAFDAGCVANPVILPPLGKFNETNDTVDGKWQCYYYGNAGSWNKGYKCFLPTGSSGLAVSQDGLTGWTKVPGREPGGAILAPSIDQDDDDDHDHDDYGAWDSVQTGVGDVIRLYDGKELHMYYFGANEEALAMGPGSVTGFRMRIGRAKSFDNGRTWVKDKGYLLDYDPLEGYFASWPRVVTFPNGPWKMFYHAFDGTKWRVYGAESCDSGDSWKRTGLVLEGGTDENDFDFCGIGTRTVAPWRNGLLMIYEGVAKDSKHRLGAAFSPSSDGTKTFEKINDGKPILAPGQGPLGDWTQQVIGTPYLLSLPDGSLRLYHCGKDGPNGKMAIGVVESKSGEISPESWTAMG